MTTLAEAIAALDGKATLSADDTLALRRIIYAQSPTVDLAAADALFKLNADAGDLSPEWCALFTEAVTDFVMRRQDPEGYVDDAGAEWLMGSIARTGRVRDDEVEMLIHVLEKADQVPAKLSAFVLSAVKAVALASVRQTGALSALDVDRLRRLIFAKGGDSNVAVTRPEAEALFDLNEAQAGAPANPAWSDFFVRAVANAVLFVPVWAPDREAELGRERWLADTSIHPFRRIEAALTHPAESAAEIRQSLHEVSEIIRSGSLVPGIRSGRIRSGSQAILEDDIAPIRDRYAADDALEAQAEAITADEAHWLVDRIGRDGRYDANEHALIDFLRANARSIDPSLSQMLARLDGRPTASVA